MKLEAFILIRIKNLKSNYRNNNIFMKKFEAA